MDASNFNNDMILYIFILQVVLWDLSNVFEVFSDISLIPNTDSVVRLTSLSQHQQTHYLTLILRNTSQVTVNITLQGRSKTSSEDAILLHLMVDCDTSGHVPINEPIQEDVVPVLPKEIERARINDMELDLSDVDENRLDLDDDVKMSLGILEEQLRDDEITSKGFKVKKTALLQPYVRRYMMDGRLEDLIHQDHDSDSVVIHRKLMDAYGNLAPCKSGKSSTVS